MLDAGKKRGKIMKNNLGDQNTTSGNQLAYTGTAMVS